MKTPLKRYIL